MTPQVISLSAAGSTAWIPVDYKQNPFNIDVAVVLSNTPNLTYKVEYTLDDVFNPAITPTAFSHATLVGLTANGQAPITSPVRAIRLTITAWTSGTATMTALQGVVNPTLYSSNGEIRVITFPGFTESLLASLVVTSTASRTANIVTITATGHGITTGSTYVGYRYFYPGSPSLVAGWYNSIVSIPDANTITFTAPGTDFGSESINGGAIYTTTTELIRTTIPGGTLKTNSRLTAKFFRGGSTDAGNKDVRCVLSASQIGLSRGTSSPFSNASITISVSDASTPSSTSIIGCAAMDGSFSNSITNPTINTSIDQPYIIQCAVSAASSFIIIPTLNAELVI